MSSIPCVAPDCEQPVHVKKRGLCLRHYNRFMYAGDLEVNSGPTDCGYCGRSLPENTGPGYPPAYCDAKCKGRAAYRRRKESGSYEMDYAKRRAQYVPKPSVDLQCETCFGSFSAKRDDARFCSNACATQYRRNNPDGSCVTEDCNGSSEAKGLCHACYKRAARADGRTKPQLWDDRRRANYHKRRALKLELPADNIRPLDVYERDEWTCGLCDGAVDRSVKYPDPFSPSLDHILPLSKGGHHLLENVQLAHLECNVRKGARVESETSAMLA